MAGNGRYQADAYASADALDALDLYLDELSRHPVLTTEQEQVIARRAQAGDAEALEVLVLSNLRFVISVAKRYQNRGIPFADLIQEGNSGLITAAHKFDPDQGVKFISYAVWWIRQAILAALARHGRSVRLPLNRATELARVLRFERDLKQTLRRDPTPAELARETGLEPSIVEMLRALNVAEVRLDATVGAFENAQLGERLVLDEVGMEEAVEAKLLQERVGLALQDLRPRDARVVRLYYGLQGEREHTLEEIGGLLGVTRERVRQLRDRALRELSSGNSGQVLRSYAVAS